MKHLHPLTSPRGFTLTRCVQGSTSLRQIAADALAARYQNPHLTPHLPPLTPHPSDHTPPSPLTPHLQTIPLSTPTPPPLPHVYRLVSSRLQAGTLTGADPEPSLGDASPICGDHAVDGSRPPFRLWSNKTYCYYSAGKGSHSLSLALLSEKLKLQVLEPKT